VYFVAVSSVKKVLLFGAGKSATCLIDYLIHQSTTYDWEVTVVDADLELARSKTGTKARALTANVVRDEERKPLIQNADLVISLLPPSLHFLVAKDCIEFQKNLLTASYVDEQIRALEASIVQKGLLFLCEMGLDPGIDHMSAMQLIHSIQAQGGRITSFRSHTGGLVAPESDDNPWHYKLSWNPRNVVRAGSAGATYKEDQAVKKVAYQDIFKQPRQVQVDGLGKYAFYPNRDSLSYIPVYGLGQAETFVRTTLRHPAFCEAWAALVAAGLTDDTTRKQPAGLTFNQWAAPLKPFVNDQNRDCLTFLGLLEDMPVPPKATSSADILQYLLESRLLMQPQDKDMIVMLHEIGYEQANVRHELRSTLVVKGEDRLRTAMAKTVGLPLGIAAKWILEGKIRLVGLHIPIVEEVYQPVLRELAEFGVRFDERIN
jgi:saccharopine dehydrogenase-like NADP-dependent oxidoreductase